ncbi:MAG TPA: GntR family transcriptional regulator [Ilumatobacter sp.]|nr:GntR family transcriptional regulator [Ilumatobacter sp.]
MPGRTRVHRLLPALPSSGVPTTVSRQLSEAIHLGLLAPGEQLPSENDLASQLGVSTASLREALSVLREQGLVETRRGRRGGTFVCGPSETSAARLHRNLHQRSAIGLRDFGDEWSAVAGTSARLAAARASSAHLENLDRLVEQLAAASAVGDRGRAHSRFFIEVALASQSERLTRAEVRLQAETGELLWLQCDEPFSVSESVERLTRLTAAIRNEDAAVARDLAEAHVLRATRWLVQTRIAAPEEST